jgi:hypothetical protein
MCIQLDLEVICKRPPKKRMPFNFHEFWSEKLHYEKNKKIKDVDV